MATIDRFLLTFLLNALWQIPLIAIVSALLGRLMRNGPASHRHVLHAAALAACLLLPLASVETSRPGERLHVQPAFAPSTVAVPVTSVLTAPARTAPPSRSNLWLPRTIAFWVFTFYSAFLAFRLALLLRAWVRTREILRNIEPAAAPPALARVWARCLAAFRLRDVALGCSPHVPSPVVAGVFRKVVLLPETLFAEQSEDVLTTAVGHEMAHLARNDFAFSLLYELLFAPVAFHPAAWFVRRQIEQTREMACDELVTGRLIDRGAYARSIVNIAAVMTGLDRPGYTLGVFDGDILERRIGRLLHHPAVNLRRARLYLIGGLGTMALCVVIASGLALSANAQGPAHNELKMAESAFNAGDFPAAIQHFKHAVELEPANNNAKLFLANALLSQFYAQSANPDNTLLSAALEQYGNVLAADPANRRAIEGIISVDMRLGRAPDARAYTAKLVQMDPGDKTALYLAGVVDWMTAYPAFVRARDASGGKPQDYAVADSNLRRNFRDQYAPVVEDGVAMLNGALAADPKYDDAMAYLNLLYRLKASMTDDAAEAAKFIATADDYVGRALAARQASPAATKASASPLNVDAPPPGPLGVRTTIAAPPPPPPPPPGAINRDAPASSQPVPPLHVPGRFWQVVPSGKPQPALVLVKQLREHDFSTLLLRTSDGSAAVLVGPFFDDPAVAKAKADLEKAGYQTLRVR